VAEDFETPYEILNAYQNGGMVGWIDSPRERGLFSESQPKSVYSEPNTAGSGEGKRALLWTYLQALDKGAYTERQTEPDCFVAGTLVRMADGTERAIEDVETGDKIASPFGGVRTVLSTIAKRYVGEAVTMRGDGCADSITSTSDHRFVSHVNQYEWVWQQAGELKKGDRLFLPSIDVRTGDYHTYDLAEEELCGENPNELPGAPENSRRIVASDGKVRALNGKVSCNRHITLNSDVAWLIGIWLAEGSTDKGLNGKPHGLVWNLCSDEMQIAMRIKSILRSQFGVQARIKTLVSKPSCLFVEIGCGPLARWMYRIAGSGNTYSKRAPKEMFSSPVDVQLACVRGWMEGDGCVMKGPRSNTPQYNMCKATGTSVSRGLIRDMRCLAIAAGIQCTETIRKAYKQSKQASEVHFYGKSAVALFPGKLRMTSPAAGKRPRTWQVDGGFACRIASASSSHFDGMVYCVEVEQDHAFIANGYAVHNCTSHCSRNARDTSRAVEILVNGEPEDFYKRGATEPTYGARGHGGAGMSPARAAMFENKTGFLVRKKYDLVDLSVYKGSIGARWGSRGVPEDVQKLCNENKVGTIRQIRSVSDARDALFNGYALASGQHAAWSADTDKDHVHRRISPGWNHAMATVGMDFTKKFWPFNVFFIANSWGSWNQAPRDWPADYPPWVPGMIVTKEDDWEVCVRSEDCYAYGNVDGFPPQKLPDFGAIGLLRNE
jgi:hypothetical protein